MNWIVAKERWSNNIIRLEIKSLNIARQYVPGHYVNIKLDKEGEKISLVISDVNLINESFSVLIQKVEPVHQRLANLNIGDVIYSVEGPLGEPIPIQYSGTVICAAGGIGIMPLFPIVKALKNAGNKVITILGAHSREYIILENEYRKIADELYIFTDDGSMGAMGFVVDGIQAVLQRGKINQVVTFGPTRMIKNSSVLTRRFDIPLIATLYSKKKGGNGTIGMYRVSTSERSKYICIDGDDFNAYYSDFDSMIKGMENIILEDFKGNQKFLRETNQYAKASND